MNIAPTATPGSQTVTVTTGVEIASFVNGFTIAASAPIIYTLNPGGSSQGATNLQVQITGLNTHFAQGTSVATFGAGITVTSLTVANATTATATINIDPAAVIGPRTVTVTTGSEIASFVNGFSVVAGVPGITEINPGGATQAAQNVSVAVTSQFTHFAQDTTTATFGAGVSIVSLTINSPTSATAVVNVDPAASVGARDVTFTTGSEVVTAPGGFTISAGTSSLLSVNPNTGQQGQQNLSVNITGQLTHFVQATTTASFGAGVTVVSLTVNSSTSATAVLTIAASATPGLQNVVVTTGSEVVTLTNGFGINAGSPSLTQVSPNAGQQGQQNLAVTITGQYTHFNQSTSQVSFGAGITVSSVSVSSATSLAASISIPMSAPAGVTSVSVTTGAEAVTLPGGFTVQPLTSGPISASPASAMQAQSIAVTITGQGTHFAQGATQARFGPGVSVGSAIAGDLGPVTVTSPTSATAMISVINNALPGSRTITVETGSETDTGTNAFTVLGTPSISAVTPPGANQGASGTVTISGSYTHFAPGTSQVSFGTGVTVTSVTATSGSSLTAAIAIDPAATPGPRPVSVQTGTENVSLPNGFSVFGPITGPTPVPTITNPTEGTVVTAPTTVTGNVVSPNLAYWTLEYEAPSSTSFTQFATGASANVTGTLDPTLMLNGNAVIRLTGVDTSGQAEQVTTTVVIARNLKVGIFTLSFNDLSVPVAGLPIQVVRTYDSRRAGASGDFGYGWTLDLNTVTVSTNIPLGQGWTMTASGSFIINYCVQESTTHVITVTFADGTTYQFSPVLSGACQQIVPPSQVSMSFAPNTSTGTTPPNAGLALPVTGPFEISGGPSGPVTLIDLDSLSTLDPDQYLSTLPDGRRFQISKQNGLQKETDLNGNTLTVTSAGITSSTGKSVSFTRDSQNRITQITDPSGNTLGYSYSAAGDLVSSANQVNQASTYTYNLTHGLLTIVDPAGAQPIRNDYDASGRLVSHTDAYGNVINYDNDLADNQEIVTDRNGNITVNEYDAAGNIVEVTDALGGMTTRTYDGNGNILTEKNALGQTTTYTYDANNNRLTQTDPLGDTTTYTYNSLNQVLTITDANNHTTTNTYDTNGNLLTTKDASGKVTTYTYNSAGLRTSMTDPLSYKTSYAYDSSGNLTQQTDALGHVTTYTYDANGNRLSQTQTRTTSSGTVTMVTSYQYDGMNRVIKTTYPDGSTTQIQYNAIGKQGVTIDQLGRPMNYTYDLMGRLTQTTYPDTTSDSSTYDPNGNRVLSTDRENRTTAYSYDPLNRLVTTTYADTATNSTKYDAIGEVTLVTDALGNQTQYAYDVAGRRTQVTDALADVTKFQYDPVGNQTQMTDANGNTTQYQYDPENRRITVIYPDTTTDQTGYDALGRTTSKTDQAGLVTQYVYDGLGRLTQVTDALSQNTKYGYDEVGNRIAQTDASNHTTTFAYDNMGRRTGRTLPLGMSESMTYDVAGNQITHTDFNGKTTTYAYDPNNNWLTRKTPDASFSAAPVTFSYTATGQRASMTDPSGTTSYTYDLRDRLTQKATPEGTLTYTYELQGNLKSMTSSNTGGTSVAYSYDPLNRLSSVKDNRLASGTTTYTYDHAGNLAGYVYPNGVQSAYTYDTLNRLTNMTVSTGAPIASYAYTLGPAGNRTRVVEVGGRTIAYGYDNLYRLTSETISGAASNNGVIGYVYDPIGNRHSRSSSVVAVPAASYVYDANDRLTTDTYDADGNTTISSGNTYAYDYDNHLTISSTNAFSAAYDGDGNRVARTASGVKTTYLVDDRNPTGYAQIVEELSSGAVQRVYTYGLSRINQSQASVTSFYGYDGQGSVRLLTDTTGAITDRYDYDAFGNILSRTGTTLNVYLYSGEQNDPTLAFSYLRARYLNTDRGRFWTGDPAEGEPDNPLSLNRYLYAEGEPTDKTDPSGEQATLQETAEALTIDSIITQQFLQSLAANAVLGKVVLTKAMGAAQGDEPIIAYQYMTASKLVFVGLTGFIPIGYNANCSKYLLSNVCAFFTPDEYNTALVAKTLLALPRTPAFRVELILYKIADGVKPIPAAVVAAEGPPISEPGGGHEFVTSTLVPFWVRRLDISHLY